MVKTHYLCDRCRKEVKQNELVRIGLGVQRYSSGGGSMYFNSDSVTSADWCNDCCHEVGIKFKPKPEPKPETTPSLEDILREWVYEAVQGTK